MYEVQTKIRVRYGETDQMGYVYYGNYASYYEVARVESLRQLGFAYRELEEIGIMLPVLENKSKYHKPAKYDELLTIKVCIPEMPALKMKFCYQIFNEENLLINSGETTLVFIKKATMKPCRMPKVMIGLLEPYFVA
ncbi:MAG: thioesterase family protein [Bacteroidetes bacterium]|nr:thioesterase family protein [Bacteroidota bacterium]MDA1121563.1 thioesterase family protein [Bacteroidota bacterium]